MELKKKRIVTIVAESILETSIIKDLKRLGSKGYTIVDARGEGARGVRSGDWDQNRNIIIQTICSEQTAHLIMDFLYDQYYDDYAIISYSAEIEVHRENKF